MSADRFCDDCAWPEACSAEMDCRRRSAGEVRAAALPEDAARIIAALSEADPEAPAGAVLLVAARAPALTVAVTRALGRIGGRA